MTDLTAPTPDDPGVELDLGAHLPHFPGEERLGDGWSDQSDPGQVGMRTLRYESSTLDYGIAVLVQRDELVDIVLVHRNGTAHHTVRVEEVVAALHLLEARIARTVSA